MAKKKKLDDLEAELAALEAELAALEGKASDLAAKPKKAPAKAAPKADAATAEDAPPEKPSRLPRLGLGRKKSDPAPEAAAQPAAEAAPDAPEAAKPKKRFGLPKLKKAADDDAAEPADAAGDNEGAASTAPAQDAPKTRRLVPTIPTKAPKEAPAPAPELPTGDLTHWRQEGRTWVRVVPDHEAPIVRRVLDEDDRVVREEPATRADLDEVNGVKAERAVGKLLTGAGGAAGNAVAKLKTLRFKRGGDGK